jgi:hypothetical protein
MSSLGWLLASIGARFHGACGWLAYRIGARRASRSHYERVLLLRGEDFQAYVHLARIAFDAGDYAGWRRELEHARRLDPVRFGRLRHPLELFQPRLAGTALDHLTDGDEGFDGAGERATWRALRPSSSGRVGKVGEADGETALPGLDARTEATPTRGGKAPDAAASRDDCVSTNERARFRELGPIAPAELQRCDLDELLRRLSG